MNSNKKWRVAFITRRFYITGAIFAFATACDTRACAFEGVG
jgi:hypothetical protein